MTMNLEQHRGRPSVWRRPRAWMVWDWERWAASIAAGGLFVAGMRKRSPARGALLAIGSVLAWWALAGPGPRSRRRGRLRAVLPYQPRQADPVTEASEESFPASDAPAWTPTTGYRVPSPTTSSTERA